MITILIPARNEEENIIPTLESITKEVQVPYEILVINDHSTDKTEELVKEYAKGKHIKILSNPAPTGSFAGALGFGFKNVDTDTVVVVMADLCDDPKTINKMAELIKNSDIVCGSRYLPGGGKVGGPALQGFFSKVVCLSLNKILGLPTTDISNAFKMYRKSTLDKVRLDTTSGVEASMEITLQAFFNGAKITEIPTIWQGRKAGKSKFKLLARSKKYLKIYLWALENNLRRLTHLPLKKFYT